MNQPVVGVPQMLEQMMTAQRIEELGLGTVLDKNTLTVEQLHATMKAALSNADYRTNAQAMQQHVRNAGGYEKTGKAYAEFVWADFFRRNVAVEIVTGDFEAAVRAAVPLARSRRAKSLPGYKGE